jgi:hypothetical protein
VISVVLLEREFGRQTSSRWRFSRKNDWIVQVTPQQATKAIFHTGALYSKNSASAPAAGAGMALLTTALNLHGVVLWSGELQGFILHEMMRNRAQLAITTALCIFLLRIS